ncbi:MAG TPA: hypothetical protein VM488_06665 [Pseudobacter sp.]|nr:hypothetical protein [Pseudobacter sp.]
MSFSFKIARNGSNQYDSNITLNEWLLYIEWDDEMQRPDGKEFMDAVRAYIDSRPGYCEWTAHPKYHMLYERPAFDHQDGMITVHGVDKETLTKMFGIAATLQATVHSPDGDLLDKNEINNPGASTEKESESKPWWRFW